MATVDPNVVIGMHSGLALLMDVHRPAQPNGYGIVYIAGSGWHAPLRADATPLKENPQIARYAAPLLAAGYTVFALNHRAAPRFRYPAALEDVQRAVRFIRFHAGRFGIRPDRIGAVGGSSGGHLASLLGVLDGRGDPDDPDPVNRESARVQCVVARAAPLDFLCAIGGTVAPMVADFLGMILTDEELPPSVEYRVHREASPLYHVSNASPPFLLLHGDADLVVPFHNSEVMHDALVAVGVPAKLIRIEGGGHGSDFPGAVNPPDYLGEIVRWFDQHLPVGAPVTTSMAGG